MTSGLLGAGIALLWGIHDFLVRFVSRSIGPAWALLCVLISGAVVLTAIVTLGGMKMPETVNGWLLSGGTGIGLAFASYFLYRAFAIGPVYLVAPVICAYPVLSVLWAFARGATPTYLDLAAIVAVSGGVVLVAGTSSEAESDRPPGETAFAPYGGRWVALGFAAASSVSFAATFALGQAAAAHAGEFEVTWVARIFAILVVVPICMRVTPPVTAIRKWWRILTLMGLLDVLAVAGIAASGSLANPEHAAVTSSTFGAVTILLAWIFLRERIAPLQWLGIFSTFAGIAVLSARV